MFVNPRWRKVVRDLWDNKPRTILVVMAIAVGVFAFGSAFITQDVLLTDMNAQYQAANTSSINLNVPSADEDLVRWVRNRDQIADAQGQAIFLVQLVTPEGEKSNLDLHAVSDDVYQEMRVNRISPAEGDWPPGRREILFERSTVPMTDAEIGDTVLIELPSGKQRELSFTGTVHDLNAIPANLFPQLTGYVTFETLGWLGFPAEYTQINAVAEGGIADTDELAVIANDIEDKLKRRDVTVSSIGVQDPSKHWGADVTQGFVAVLSGIGVFSLLLSGFLVVNTITAVLSQQKRQIGIMKAVGAKGGQIIGIYLLMVAAFGILALVVALPLGAGLAYLSALSVANFLNIDILNFHIPFNVLVLEVLAALIAPMTAAMFPIINGTRVTVQEAVSDYGLGTSRKRGLIDLTLARVRGLPRPVLLSLRNTFRRKGRLFLTLGTLTLAGALFISVVNVRGSLLAELNNILGVYNYDIAIILDDTYQTSGVERRIMRVPGVTRVQALPTVIAKRVRLDGSNSSNFELHGVPPGSSLLQPTIVEGRWLEPGDRNAVVVSTEWLGDETDVGVGDTVTFEVFAEEYEWEVVGIYLLPGDPTAYSTIDRVSRARKEPGLASVYLIGTQFRDGAFQEAVAKELEDELNNARIGVSQSLTRDLIVGASIQQFDFLIVFLMGTAVLVAAVGGLGLAGTMSLNVLERTREIGVMRAIGASNSAVRDVVLTEGVLIGLLSWTLALPLSILMSVGFSAILGIAIFQRPIPPSISPPGFIIWLVVALVISAIASLLPSRRAARVSVREALAYE